MGEKNLLLAFAVAAAAILALTSDLRADVWTIETVDSAGDMGYYSSMALDGAGKAHISYKDGSSSDLKYATNASGPWTTQTVDSAGTVGYHTSLALDSAGKAHISYQDRSSSDLKYATNASGSWTTQTVDSTGYTGYDTSIAVDSAGKAHISYHDGDTYDLKYATNASDAWVTQTVDSPRVYDPSIALDGAGKAHISYYERNNGDLKYATNTSGAWVTQTVDSAGTVGLSTSLALDGAGKAHISYYDQGNGDLKYATNASGAWVTQTVESGGNVGMFTSIALDSSGNAHIGYYDYTNYDLKYVANTSGSWITQIVDSTDVDFYGAISIALDSSGKAHISYYGNGDLKYATNAEAVLTPSLTISEQVGQGETSGVYTGSKSRSLLAISEQVAQGEGTGTYLTYTMNYANTGRGDATGVVITDIMPSGATFVSATAGGTESGGVVTWNIGTLGAGGGSGQVGLTVRVSDTPPDWSIITNADYTIDSNETDPVSGAAVLTTIYACVPAVASGDVNGDGSVDVLDAIKVIRIALGIE